ncbi:MAG: hypothetical protein K2N47_03250 [Clostridia bacterium]|nr:hypothetical protein [Clostridia bacterium]
MSKEKEFRIEERAKADAANEGKIKASDLLTEIQPLMRDYFCGKFTVAGQWMIMAMHNGQKFLMKIEQVA